MPRIAEIYRELLRLRMALESYGPNGKREGQFEYLFNEYYELKKLKVVK